MAVLVLAPLACSEPLGSPPGLRVETSTAVVSPGQEFRYTVVNGTSNTVLLAACCGLSVYVDRNTGNGWAAYRLPGACVAICPGAEPLPPGASDSGIVSIPDVGLYRLRLGRIMGGAVVWDLTSSSVQVGWQI
jgi:hypothetical protein